MIGFLIGGKKRGSAAGTLRHLGRVAGCRSALLSMNSGQRQECDCKIKHILHFQLSF
jgi:hypothetical protein